MPGLGGLATGGFLWLVGDYSPCVFTEHGANPDALLRKGMQMAIYKYPQYLSPNDSVEFDKVHHPGQPTPYSGIYRCEGCGENEVSTQGHPMPPQNHHQHSPAQGTIRWRLIVATK
jgi:hypothetical protein